jgi:hypothetical protein
LMNAGVQVIWSWIPTIINFSEICKLLNLRNIVHLGAYTSIGILMRLAQFAVLSCNVSGKRATSPAWPPAGGRSHTA